VQPRLYEIGDIVYLKSGSPKLTVNGYRTIGLTYSYTCSWFTKQDECKTDEFLQDALAITKDL
jgi:uncharacterized protein YodC (DUF2158 family)